MTLYSNNLEMTDTLREIAEELGPDEVAARAAKLSEYATTLVVAAYSPDVKLAPAQAIKWAQFAASVFATAWVDGHEIKRAMTAEERVITVLQNERSDRQHAEWRREREERERREAEAKEAAQHTAENGGEPVDGDTLKGITL